MAEVKVLIPGYTSADSGDEKTCATISLVRDGDIVMVVDPGVLENQKMLIDKLKENGLTIDDVNYVFLTHSHLDHYRNTGMFPRAKVLEYFGIWEGQRVKDWKEQLTKDIKIIKTPGHDYSDLSLLVNTPEGKVAIIGDVFWKENFPKKDPYASDLKKLEKSRQMILKVADWIVPGHADIFKVKK
jgi:glyoxylase-like metal-dependent hydrolase (beta-lactamase superfamily II)